MQADAQYVWEYAVKDGPSYNDFGHKESRAGAHTDGKYFVALPDGRLQTVTYTVDGNGGYIPLVVLYNIGSQKMHRLSIYGECLFQRMGLKNCETYCVQYTV